MKRESPRDDLQDALWCCWLVLNLRHLNIKNPKHPTGLIVVEMNAIMELHLILETHMTHEAPLPTEVKG